MRTRVNFHDPQTNIVIDSCEIESIIDENEFGGIGLIHSIIGIDVDPAELLERIESDGAFRRSLLALVYPPMFAGMNGGQFDAIAEARVQEAQDICRAVEPRHACLSA